MKQLLLIGLLLPFLVSAQVVSPVLSPDYQSRIDSIARRNPLSPITDSSNNMQVAPLRYYGYPVHKSSRIRRIDVNKEGSIQLQPVKYKTLSFGTTVTISAALLRPTKVPSLQNEYAQGRSDAGTLKWRGAETGELFSYGPSLQTLSFDGSNYIYDNNGRLAAGNGVSAYDNSLLRTGSLVSQYITLHARLRRNYERQIAASLRIGQNDQQLVLDRNRNKINTIAFFLNGQRNRITFSSNYSFRRSQFSNSNRNGLLNRAWQYSLLTPASFDNTQGSLLTAGTQRSYSAAADNPLFLLREDVFLFREHQHAAFLSAGYRHNRLTINISQSLEDLRLRSDESRLPGTAGFLPGAAVLRQTHDKNYSVTTRIGYGQFNFSSKIRGNLSANYLYSNRRSLISYNNNASRYAYQRSANDLSLIFSPDFRGNLGYKTYLLAGLSFTGRLYASNTSTVDNTFLPSVSGYATVENPFNLEYVNVRLFGGFTRFNSEMSLSRSAGYASLLQYSVAEANEYLPVKEILGFDNLASVEHRELTAGFEVSYKDRLILSLNWFNRRTANDLFPVNNGNHLSLLNMASHRNKGMEAELRYYSRSYNTPEVYYEGTISIAASRTRVMNVAAGYEGTPIAGFSDVYKALVKGQPMGVIMGSTWLRDAAGNKIISNDGFPLVNNNPRVIGDPNPDFIIKTSQKLTFKKKVILTIEPEWRVGGDVWNGTRALLDYYGRSAGSASQRNVTGYVFEGVLQNGSHNTIPVSFYDPSKPVEQNRWVRYGAGGVAEEYIEKADCIRINTISLSYKPKLKKKGAELTLGVYASNIILWTRYKGVDPYSLLFDEPAMAGLDFFNTPGVRTAGFTATFQL